MEIRYLEENPEVVPVLAAWIFKEWSYLYPEMTLQGVVRFLGERGNRKRLPLTFVAIEAGQPVGTVSLTTFDMETRSDLSYWLTSLYVAEPWRRRRIGSRLVETAETKAAELGISRLFLFTTDAALTGSFYAKLGWTVKEQTRYHSQPVTIMEKDLFRG